MTGEPALISLRCSCEILEPSFRMVSSGSQPPIPGPSEFRHTHFDGLGRPSYNEDNDLNLCLISLLSIGAIAAGGSPNLVPDPKFKSQWSQFDIVRPCQVKLSDGKAHLSGGTVFLHSRLFDAPPAVQLMVEATVQGEGTAAVEILWWDRFGLPAKPHRSSSKKRSTGRSSKISFLIRSPQTAVKAQVRLVVQGGAVTFSNPKLGVIEGKLLLHLDGAAPGPKPKQQWVDRTNINHPLSVMIRIVTPQR